MRSNSYTRNSPRNYSVLIDSHRIRIFTAKRRQRLAQAKIAVNKTIAITCLISRKHTHTYDANDTKLVYML